MKTLPIVLVWAIGSLTGCAAAPEGAIDESISEEESLLLTNGTFALKNYQTGLCLGVSAGTPTAGTPLVVWNCDKSANQTWSFAQSLDFGSTVAIRNNVAPDRCLNSAGLANGSAETVNTCNKSLASTNQWSPRAAGPDLNGKDCYRFAVRGASTKVFGVSGGKPGAGIPVILWNDFNDPYTHPDQIWCVYPQ